MITQDTILLAVWAPLVALFVYMLIKLLSRFKW